ncbi:MAG TPA: photosynthetic reaction center cytochrome c subunit family protein [Thermoanaerobaculia bacterium]
MRTRVLIVLLTVTLATTAVPQQPAQNEKAVDLLTQIKGKEHLPAGEVFKNVTVLKSIPAARFLRIMDQGWSRALGVPCEHCHVEGRWDSDELRAKRAAREMAILTAELNQKLGKMENLDGEAVVNCATCHRGEVVPATK